MKKLMSCLLALSGGACLLTGISAAIVSSLGHEELYFRYLGPLFVVLLGVLFVVAIVGNLTVNEAAVRRLRLAIGKEAFRELMCKCGFEPKVGQRWSRDIP